MKKILYYSSFVTATFLATNLLLPDDFTLYIKLQKNFLL